MSAVAFARPRSVDGWIIPILDGRSRESDVVNHHTSPPLSGSRHDSHGGQHQSTAGEQTKQGAAQMLSGVSKAKHILLALVFTFAALSAHIQDTHAQRTIEFSTQGGVQTESDSVSGDDTAPVFNEPATVIRVGYRAIVPMSALFVIQGKGMAAQKNLVIEPIRYSNDEALAKDLASGAVDIGYLDPGPILVQAETVDTVQIIAATALDSVAFVTRGDLTRFISPGEPASGMRRFARFDDERIRLATLPRTTVSAVAFRLWFYDKINMSQQDALLFGTNYAAIWRAMLEGKLDGAIVPEPMVTDILARDPTATVVLEGNEILSNQPTGVVAASTSFLSENRRTIVDFLELHLKATGELIDNPGEAAGHVTTFASYGQVQGPQMLAAITSSAVRFETNPVAIVDALKAVGAYMTRIGRMVRLPALVTLIYPVFHR